MLMVHVNGKDYEVEQDTKLMRFLRDDLRLTSVKDGCSQGACGTCICKGRRCAVRILYTGYGDVCQRTAGSKSGSQSY